MSGGRRQAKLAGGRPLDGGLGVIGRLEASCKLHKWAWQVSEIESFDKTLRRTDLASGSRSKEPMQLLMCRRMAMLRHGLEAAERV